MNPRAFPPKVPKSCSELNGQHQKKKKKEFYLQDYHSACPLSINLSLNRQDRFMSK